MKENFFLKLLTSLPSNKSIVESIYDKYRPEHFEHGQAGLADLVNGTLNTEFLTYVCTDTTGNSFLYKDADSKIQSDDRARSIIKAIKEPIIELTDKECKRMRHKATYDNLDNHREQHIQVGKCDSRLKEIENMDHDDTVFRKALAAKTYISTHAIKANLDQPEKLVKRLALEDHSKKALSQYGKPHVFEKLSALGMEGYMKIFSNVKTTLDFLAKNIYMLEDGTLIYTYDERKDTFCYCNIIDRDIIGFGRPALDVRKFDEKFPMNFANILYDAILFIESERLKLIKARREREAKRKAEGVEISEEAEEAEYIPEESLRDPIRYLRECYHNQTELRAVMVEVLLSIQESLQI
jgi:hypothetical protein